jgi:4'-phosphopantetheinyl transferase
MDGKTTVCPSIRPASADDVNTDGPHQADPVHRQHLPLALPPAFASSLISLCLTDIEARPNGNVDTSVLADWEHLRASGFRDPRDRERYLVAHVVLRETLSAYVGVPASRLSFGRDACPLCGDPHGRPTLIPKSLTEFSLSHAGDLVLIGVARTPIGVDVERIAAPALVADVAPGLHRAEWREVAARGASEQPTAFTRLWVRKEAYLKGLGTGVARDLSLDYVGEAGGAPAPEGWLIASVEASAGYEAALALQQPTGHVGRPRPSKVTETSTMPSA